MLQPDILNEVQKQGDAYIPPQMVFFSLGVYGRKFFGTSHLAKTLPICGCLYTYLAAFSHIVQEVSLRGIDDDDMR